MKWKECGTRVYVLREVGTGTETGDGSVPSGRCRLWTRSMMGGDW